MNILLYNYDGIAGLWDKVANSDLKNNEFTCVSPISIQTEEMNSQDKVFISMPGLEDVKYIYHRHLDSIIPRRLIGKFQVVAEALDESIMLQSLELEMCIRMAQRTRLHYLSYTELLFYIDRVTHFWHVLIACCDVEMCISSVVPHSFTDYLLACVCTHKGIPFISQLPGGMSKHAFMYCHLRDRCIENSSFRIDNTKSGEALSDFKSLLFAASDPTKTAIPHAGQKAIRAKKTYNDNKSFLLRYRSSTFTPLDYLKSLAECYDAAAIDPRDGYAGQPGMKTNIYFMHYQPEATTMPMAKRFACQKQTVSYIRSCLGPNEILFVKEHPQQFIRTTTAFSSDEHLKAFHNFRRKEDYSFIAGFNNTYLVDRRLTIFDLANLRPTVWISYGSISLQSIVLGLDTCFLPTMNPYRMLVDQSEFATLLTPAERIDCLCRRFGSYLFPITKYDHDSIDDSQACVELLGNIIKSYWISSSDNTRLRF